MTTHEAGFRRRMATTAVCALLASAVGLAPGCGGTVVTGIPDGGTADGHHDSGRPGHDSSMPDSMPDQNAGDHVTPDVVQPDAPPPGVPIYHRPDDSQCATTPPPGMCMFPGIGTCQKDSNCADGGANGRCISSFGGAADCFCTYDTCEHDTDCKTGQLCVCHGSGYTENQGNACMPGNCRVDSDCGSGGYCSPSHGTSGCGEVTGYYCHTPKDTCVNDSDCGGGVDVCAWSRADGRWKCQMFLPCA